MLSCRSTDIVDAVHYQLWAVPVGSAICTHFLGEFDRCQPVKRLLQKLRQNHEHDACCSHIHQITSKVSPVRVIRNNPPWADYPCYYPDKSYWYPCIQYKLQVVIRDRVGNRSMKVLLCNCRLAQTTIDCCSASLLQTSALATRLKPVDFVSQAMESCCRYLKGGAVLTAVYHTAV